MIVKAILSTLKKDNQINLTDYHTLLVLILLFMIILLPIIEIIYSQFEPETADNTSKILGTKKQGAIALSSRQWPTLVH